MLGLLLHMRIDFVKFISSSKFSDRYDTVVLGTCYFYFGANEHHLYNI